MPNLLSKTLKLVAATSLLLTYPTLAAAQASSSFTVSAQVPYLCFVIPQSDLVITDGSNASGQVTEACNKGGGYTVMATYRELAEDETAVLEYNGQTVELPHGGQVALRVSNLATIKTVSYAVQSAHLDQPVSVSLSLVT